jgi:hypothetical protein
MEPEVTKTVKCIKSAKLVCYFRVDKRYTYYGVVRTAFDHITA